MNHHFINWIAVLLIAVMLTGCGAAEPTTPQTDAPATTTAPTEAPTEAATEAATEAPTGEATTAPTEAPTEPTAEGTVSGYVDEAYAEQIGRYYTALTEKWEEGQYFDSDMSALPYYYYEGEPLDNVGFAYQDLNSDGQSELIVGAILNAELDPVVFEIWTLVDGAPVMVAQSGSRNRYFLQFFEEENAWYVANEGSNNAANFGTYYLMLIDGKLEVTQGIVFDATADEENPWFMAYDLDWDAGNDEPIDEDMANAIMDSNRAHYTVAEYIPYSLYK